MTKARDIADLGSNDVLDTTASGIDVTGSVTSDGLTVDGTATIDLTSDANPTAKFSRGSNNTTNVNYYYNTTLTGQLGASSSAFEISAVGASTPLNLFVNGTIRQKIDTNGDITMYKDDGSTAGAIFDASSGNLGIGNNTSISLGSNGYGIHIKAPATKDGIIKLDSSDANTSGWVQFTENGTDQWRVAYDPSNNHLEFTESGVADRMVIKDSTGFVGVGLSEPRQLLHVNQTTASSDAIVRITNSNTPSTGGHRVEFADGIGTTEGSNVFRYGYIAGERSGGSNDGHIIIGTKPDNSTSPREHLRVTSSGQLIITGTYNGNARDDAYLVFDIKNSNGDSKKAQIHAIKTADISSELIFSTTASHTFDERMRIADNGNIGINYDDPTRKLYVRGADNSTGGNVVAVRNNNSSAGAFINFIAGSNNAPSIGAKGNDIVFNDDGYAGNENLRIRSTGGITFNGDTALANALDDYEEGVYQYALTGNSGGSMVVRSNYAYASYTKIGNLVTVNCRWETSGTNTASGYLKFSLPYTAENLSDQANSMCASSFFFRMGAGHIYNPTWVLAEGTNYLIMYSNTSTGDVQTIDASNFDNNCEGYLSITYRTN
jgi:hypothetical protein